MNLSERKNTVVLNYGCAKFNKYLNTIFEIGSIYHDNQYKKLFSRIWILIKEIFFFLFLIFLG